MADMLVKLYELPDGTPIREDLRKKGIVIRKPIGPELNSLMAWIEKHFTRGWAAETQTAFFRVPKGVYIAQREKTGEMLGFACYDATVRGFFGPTGVAENERGQGIGGGLLLACLTAMREEGYGYAIIGSAGPTDFYRKICGATEIEGSVPGVYRGMMRG